MKTKRHYPIFTCAGSVRRAPKRPAWDALPLVRGITLLCALVALWGVL